MKVNISPENKKYIISELRKDKIIYATEATATNVVCLLVFLFSNQYFAGQIKEIINLGAVLVAVVYTLYMGIGNFFRLKRIQQLEKEIDIKI